MRFGHQFYSSLFLLIATLVKEVLEGTFLKLSETQSYSQRQWYSWCASAVFRFAAVAAPPSAFVLGPARVLLCGRESGLREGWLGLKTILPISLCPSDLVHFLSRTSWLLPTDVRWTAI